MNLKYSTKTITESYSGQATDEVILMNSTSSENPEIIYTLPPVASCEGQFIKVLVKGAERWNRVIPNGIEGINGLQSDFIMYAVGDNATFFSDGSSWYITDKNFL